MFYYLLNYQCLKSIEQITDNYDSNCTDSNKQSQQFGFIAFRNIIIEGSESVVTAIIKDKITPSCAPLANNASATGIVPNISAYIGTPINVANITQRDYCFLVQLTPSFRNPVMNDRPDTNTIKI